MYQNIRIFCSQKLGTLAKVEFCFVFLQMDLVFWLNKNT